MDGEIGRRSGFARALRKEDREAFEEIIDVRRGYALEAGNATNPFLYFHLTLSTV